MPCVGEKIGLVLGAYANQPPSGAPPRNHDVFRKMPPNRKIQNDSALSRGKATSRAPTWIGIR
jgi:hypothetical protein